MRKCPGCAEENSSENLFCKHCGHCLLAPDPEEDRRPTATDIVHDETTERLDFYDDDIVMKVPAAKLTIKRPIAPSVIVGWLFILNLLVFILMSEIARYIVSK